MAIGFGAQLKGALLFACVCFAYASNAFAQVTLPEEYSKTVKSAEAVGALGPSLFGDDTSLYTGATTFSATDVSLRGNSALPVAVGRRFSVQSRDASERSALLTRDGGFADWELDIPHLHGVFAKNKGWQVDGWTEAGKNLRCSLAQANQAEPPTEQGAPSGFVEGFKYWSGNSLYVPGAGDQELLVAKATNNPHRPSDGKQYVWVTNNQWYFSCLNQTANSLGDAFLAVDPSGTRYWFDWFVTRHASILSANGSALQREEVLILPTRVEDRFGNWVTYTYEPSRPSHLKEILASDGRKLTLTYSGDWISSVSDGTRIWSYVYGNGLTEVVLPDQSKWTIDFSTLRNAYTTTGYAASLPCSQQTANANQASYTGTITHPSGAVGEFSFRSQMHGRSYVQKVCPGGGGNNEGTFAINPRYFEVVGITSKKITGPALTPLQWTYTFGPANMSWAENCVGTTCPSTKTLEVTGPGEYRRYTFGNRWRDNDGKLLVTETGDSPTQILRTETNTYQLDPTGQLYPAVIGTAGFARGDGSNTKHTPMTRRVITQQGRAFNWDVGSACGPPTYDKLCFDEYANPTQTTRASASWSRTDRVSYAHNTALWVLGQPKQSVHVDSGSIEWRHEYDGPTALPVESYAFEKLQHKATYNADGTLATVSDGRDTPTYNTTITFGAWVRGIPQVITYPDGNKKEAWVDPNTGWIDWVEDEGDYRTCYAYDVMGRLKDVFHASNAANTCDTEETLWNGMHRSFARSSTADFGLPIGHWKDEVRTGDGYTVTHYDGLWRPVVVERFDSANKAATWTQAVTRYAPGGGAAFQSYPMTGLSNHATANTGTRTAYDGLGRPTRIEQDSELGPLVTLHEYLTDFQTRTTSPRNEVTQTSYQTYDQPSTDFVRGILHPEGTATDIPRDAFGKPLYITRRAADWSKSLTRYYAYNAAQELSRTTEPETGVTLMGYDLAGNVAWSASGLAANTPCDDTSAATLARKSTRKYDQRNRLTELEFGDDTGEQVWTYTPDGLPATVWTYNGPGRTLGVYNAYSYNSRRMLGGSGEMLHQAGWYTWSLGYGYDKNGFQTVQLYPDTTSFTATVNALGQTTGITGTSGTYVSGASYHPNGALKQFTYGNGIVHTLDQNLRGLPDRSKDAYGSQVVLDDSFDYDFNGNVAAISDGRLNGDTSRTMTYDGLDRLTSVTSPMFNGTIRYTYDVLDNIETVVAPANGVGISARDLRYCYEAATNRLQFLRTGAGTCSNGAATTTFVFDPQGNVRSKNTQPYTFTFDNRLREVGGKEKYRYDANGRRVSAEHATLGSIRSDYNMSGQLSFQADGRTGKNLAYVYLAGSLVATREQPTAGGAAVLRFHHTDALGSPVAMTDVTRAVTEISKYEPYGSVLNRSLRDRHGFTGHFEDSLSGLNYMQQRYYDPACGCFLSVDPVTAFDNGDMRFFHRYAYAFNNPYTFVDPDGRETAMFQGSEYQMKAPDPAAAGQVLGLIADFTPVVGDVKGVYEALQNPTWGNVAAAGVGLVPIVGDVGGKAIKNADNMADALGGGGKAAPDFIVSPNGTVFPVPQGAQGPVPVINNAGNQTGVAYAGGSGGPLNSRVDTIRVMNPTPARGASPGYPTGYVTYQNASRQAVDPLTGRTLPHTQSHFPVE